MADEGTSVEAGEPALPYLLLSAALVEIHDQVRRGGFEIGRWIVEGQVRVLADTDKRHIDGLLPQPSAHVATDGGRITLAIEQMVAGNPGGPDQALEEIAAEAGGMLRTGRCIRRGERADEAPVEIGLLHQPIEKRDLRRPGGGDDAGAAALMKRRPQAAGRLRGRGRCKLRRVRVHPNLHAGQ